MRLALFDLDNTLLCGDSDHAWGEFMVELGVVDGAVYRQRNDDFYAHYRAGTLDINEYLAFALTSVAGHTPAALKARLDQFVQTRIEPMIHRAALDLLAAHRNDLCAIVTATNDVVTRPIADRLGVPTLLACEAELFDGCYTGRATGVPCFREGKVTRVEAWLATLGHTLADFSESLFYSDSHNDLPLLSAVTHPVAVDPDATLEALARARGWPVISLEPQREEKNA